MIDILIFFVTPPRVSGLVSFGTPCHYGLYQIMFFQVYTLPFLFEIRCVAVCDSTPYLFCRHIVGGCPIISRLRLSTQLVTGSGGTLQVNREKRKNIPHFLFLFLFFPQRALDHRPRHLWGLMVALFLLSFPPPKPTGWGPGTGTSI